MNGFRRPRKYITIAAVTLMSLYGIAEYVHWRAQRSRLGQRADGTTPHGLGADDPGPSAGLHVIVVLGYKNRSARANSVNRSRVRAAMRSIVQPIDQTVMVTCGSSVAGPVPEGALLARELRKSGYEGRIMVDSLSLTTWENVENAIQLIDQLVRAGERVGAIAIASNPLHGELARAFLHQQRPDLARLLISAEDYRFGEDFWLRIPAAVFGLIGIRALLRDGTAKGRWIGNRGRTPRG